MRFRLDSSLDDATSWTAAPARAQRELIGTIAGAALLEGGRTVRRWDDALSALDWLDLDRRRRPGQWVGFLAYELGRLLEPAAAFRRQAAGDDRLPLFHWGWTGDDHHRLGRRLRTGFDRNAPSAPEAERLPAAPPAPDWTSQFSRGAYERAVARCIDYIAAGDVFQVNLSQRLSMPFGGSAEALYSALCRQSPAPYAALLEWDQLALISNSPELFLRVEPDGRIVTRPIKGTRPAGPGNAHLAEELRASAKDAAELNMIVDLERNDLGRVCEVGSVRVTQSRDIEAYPSVFHGVATVEGRLRAGVGLVELLRATFPGGSVTGAPKIRAMQIIEEIEPCPRGAYCGAIGRLDSDGSLTLNVAIRTMMLQKRRRLLHIPVGGGNVADSDPAAEYEETLVKARAMLMAANQVARTAPRSRDLTRSRSELAR